MGHLLSFQWDGPTPIQQHAIPAAAPQRRRTPNPPRQRPTIDWLPVRPVEGRLQGLGVASALLEVGQRPSDRRLGQGVVALVVACGRQVGRQAGTGDTFGCRGSLGAEGRPAPEGINRPAAPSALPGSPAKLQSISLPLGLQSSPTLPHSLLFPAAAGAASVDSTAAASSKAGRCTGQGRQGSRHVYRVISLRSRISGSSQKGGGGARAQRMQKHRSRVCRGLPFQASSTVSPESCRFTLRAERFTLPAGGPVTDGGGSSALLHAQATHKQDRPGEWTARPAGVRRPFSVQKMMCPS